MLSIEYIKDYLLNNKSNLELISEEYINSKSLMVFHCKIHKRDFNYTFNGIKKTKSPCPLCNSKINDSIIPELIKIHKNRYEYFKIDKRKIKIKCKKHGIFEQDIYSHLNGSGCPRCSGFKKTTNCLLKEFKEIHGEYEYPEFEYKSSHDFIKIICKKHGEFNQKINNHLSGQKCKLCSTNVPTIDEAIKELSTIHENKYDYSLIDFKNRQSTIDIICKKHGLFSLKLSYHLNGTGCKKCIYIEKTDTTADFIEKSKKVHGDIYNYSKSIYLKNLKKIEIICEKHGSFWQIPNDHKNGAGCPVCKTSKGERGIIEFLEKIKIKYQYQYKFDECRNILPLPFDFYIPEYNTCIEFDGAQHYSMNDFFGGKEAFEKLKINDSIKDEYCRISKINLIRIKKLEDINNKLNFLNKN